MSPQVITTRSVECEQLGSDVKHSASGDSFHLSINSSEPITISCDPPAINSSLEGTINSDGVLTLNCTTDCFPSHGVRVTRTISDSPTPTEVLLEEIIFDASHIEMTNKHSFHVGAELFSRLNNFENEGAYCVRL